MEGKNLPVSSTGSEEVYLNIESSGQKFCWRQKCFRDFIWGTALGPCSCVSVAFHIAYYIKQMGPIFLESLMNIPTQSDSSGMWIAHLENYQPESIVSYNIHASFCHL